MKNLLFILPLFIIVGCSSYAEHSLPDPIKTNTGMVIPFHHVIIPKSKMEIAIPTAARFIQSPSTIPYLWLQAGETEGPDVEIQIITYFFPIKKSVNELFAAVENCNPINKTIFDSPKKLNDINDDYKFTNFEKIFSSENVELYSAKNDCNFPGGLVDPPQERWNRTEDLKKLYGDDFIKLCSYLKDMNYVRSSDLEIIDMPAFFDNQEYVLKIENEIFRIRTRKHSVNKRSQEILETILKSARPITR